MVICLTSALRVHQGMAWGRERMRPHVNGEKKIWG